MRGDPHAQEPDLRALAERLVEAASAARSGDEGEDVDMLITAYTDAVSHRREELQDRLSRLQLDEAIVRLDAAEAVGVDVGGRMLNRLAAEGITPEDLIERLRRLAREAADGTTRAQVRRWLAERGLPLDDDGPDDAREGT